MNGIRLSANGAAGFSDAVSVIEPQSMVRNSGRQPPLASCEENRVTALWFSHASQKRKPSWRFGLFGPSRPCGLYASVLNRWLSTTKEFRRWGVDVARSSETGRSDRTSGREAR